jgi:hypothetical protein
VWATAAQIFPRPRDEAKCLRAIGAIVPGSHGAALATSAGMPKTLRPRVQQLIDDVTVSLAKDPDERAERRLRYLLALLHAAIEPAEELDLVLGPTRPGKAVSPLRRA